MKRKVATLVVLLSASGAASGGHVETLDARTIAGDVLAVTAEAVILTAPGGARKVIARRDVGEIVFGAPSAGAPADPMTRPGQAVLVTRTGDVISAAGLQLAGGKWAFENPLLGRASVPIDTVRRVYLPSGGLTGRQVRERCDLLKLAGRTRDALVIVDKKGQWLVAEGVLKAVDGETISFTWRDEDRKMKRRSVRAVHMAGAAPKPPATGGSLVGRDGTVISFTSVVAAAGAVTIETPTVGRRKVPVRAVSGVRFRSDRVVRLDRLKPQSVREHGFFDKTFRYRTARAIAGGPIRLGGRAYAAGLSLHSFCELTYRLDGAYTTFVAVVGIDDAVRPGGDATLTILANGKVLGGPLRLKGTDKPHLVRLGLGGARTLTLRVEFGADGLDVADHVDLADARLIK